jgi:hypothetical protein
MQLHVLRKDNNEWNNVELAPSTNNKDIDYLKEALERAIKDGVIKEYFIK